MENKKNITVKTVKTSKPNMEADRSKSLSSDASFSLDKATYGFKNGFKNSAKSLTGLGGTEENSPASKNGGKTAESSGSGSDGNGNQAVSLSPIKLINVAKPSITATAIQHTSKHFDVVLGIDIHWTQIPPPPSFNIIPLPLPHPFVGIVFDPMDYIKFTISIPKFVQNLSDSIPASIPMGGSIMVHGRHKATTTTSVMGVLIPFKHVTALIPVYRIPFPQEAPHEGEVYYGSKTVIGQSAEMSGNQPQHVLTCMGMPFGTTMLPSMPSKPRKNPLAYFAYYNNFASMYVQINTGKPVLIGGPFVPHVYTLGEMAMRFAGMALMKGLGKALKGVMKGLGKGLTKLNRLLAGKFGKQNPISRGLCHVGLEPVNFATGEMFFDWEDFIIEGSTPLKWENTWYSHKSYDTGILGNGVFNNHDLFIEPDYENGYAEWANPAENVAMMIPIPEVGEEKNYFRDQKIWQFRPNAQTWVIYKGLDTYTYKKFQHKQGYEVYKVVHIMYNNGTERTYSYQGSGLLLSIIKDLNSGYEISAVAHPEQDRISEIYAVFNDKRELQVRYDYDDNGNLTHVWDIHNKAIVFEYDGNNLVVKRTNRNNMSYTWEYDKKRRVLHSSGLDKMQEGKLEYFEDEGYTKVIYPQQNNKTEFYYYDENTLVYKKIDGEGGETWFDYTSHGELKMIGSAEGRVQGYTYDKWGNIAKYHTTDGEEYLYRYNEQNQLLTRFAPSGTSEMWTYDEYGRMTSYKDAAEVETTYQYVEYDRLPVSSTNVEFEVSTFYEYNTKGQLVHLYNTIDAEQFWKYDRYGRILSFNPRPRTRTVWERDQMGRVVGLKEQGQRPLEIRYDAYDLPVYATDGTQEWLMSYTPMGSLKRQVRRNALTFKKEEALSFGYDAYENLMTITNEKGEIYRFTRNANNEVIKETGFDGQTKLYVRDQDGLVVNTLLPNGKKISYEYDLAGRLTQTHYPDGSYEAFQYNNMGLLVNADNEMSSVNFTRNALGLVTMEHQGDHSVQYEYDSFGQLLGLRSSLGAEVQYNYDQLGRLQNVNASQTGVERPWEMQLQNNADHLSQSRQYTGGVKSTFEYDHTGMPVSQKVSVGKTTTLERNYNWASGSRLMEVLDKVSGRKTSFDYDVFGSLAGADYGDGTSELKNPDSTGCLYESTKRTDRIYDKGGKLLRDKKWFYHYDEEGNLLLKSTRPINIARVSLDEEEDLRHPLFRQIEQERLQEKHKNEPTISHYTPEKADLNEWQSGDWAYEWFANGMLAKVKRPDGREVTFEYDALGRRTAKIYNGEITRFVWDGNVLFHEWKYEVKNRPQLIIDEEGNVEKNQTEPVENLVTWVYENGNYVPSAKIIEGQKYSIISDYIGRPIQSFDEEGNQIWSTEYDIYGRLKNLKGNKNFIPFRQLGQYEDDELGGLYYNRYRYYDNEQGNYISKDPIELEGGFTLYSFVNNSNVFCDIFGLNPIIVLGEGQTSVDEATRLLRNAGYNAESMAVPRSQWKGGPAPFDTPEKLQKAVDWNKNWLRNKIDAGYKIVTIGPDGRNSVFYNGELEVLKEKGVAKYEIKKLPNGETILQIRQRIDPKYK